MPRNGSGTYTLPAGNPVAANTIIATSWANPTMTDIGDEITSSLDRSGRGAMLAGLKLYDGILGTPGLSFSTETSSGWYRVSSGIIAGVISGAEIYRMTSGGLTLTQNLTLPASKYYKGLFDGGATSTKFITTATDGATLIEAVPSGTGTETRFIAHNATGANADYAYLGMTATKAWLAVQGVTARPLGIYVGGAERMLFNADGKIGVGRTADTDPFEVAGVIRSTSGGFKFPDNTTQTTAFVVVPQVGSVLYMYNYAGGF